MGTNCAPNTCSVTDAPGVLVPLRFAVEAARPNPTARGTTLRFALPAAGGVGIDLFDAGGRLVRTLAQGPMAAGYHSVTWDGNDASGSAVDFRRVLLPGPGRRRGADAQDPRGPVANRESGRGAASGLRRAVCFGDGQVVPGSGRILAACPSSSLARPLLQNRSTMRARARRAGARTPPRRQRRHLREAELRRLRTRSDPAQSRARVARSVSKRRAAGRAPEASAPRSSARKRIAAPSRNGSRVETSTRRALFPA